MTEQLPEYQSEMERNIYLDIWISYGKGKFSKSNRNFQTCARPNDDRVMENIFRPFFSINFS